MKPLLSIKNLSYSLSNGNILVRDMSIDLFPGDCMMLIGSNGSGKSTLLKLISGALTPTSGAIYLEAEILRTSIRKRAHSIATMNQDPNAATFSELSVYENYLIRTRGSLQMAKDYLYPFNPKLPDRMNTPAGKLSGGERQALGLALCLLSHPKLLLLDEHTSALDPESEKRLMEITYDAIRSRNITAIICTHNVSDALHYGNRLIALQRGSLLADISAEEKKNISKEDLFTFY